MFYLITYATEIERTKYLNASQITYLGLGKPWTGYLDKLRAVREFLQDKDPMDIICFTNADDVIQLGSNPEIESKFRQMKSDLVFSAETTCYPWSHVQNLYPFAPTVYKYLNSGGYIGYAFALRKLFEDDFTKSPCDQSYLTYKFLNEYFKQNICLDVNCLIFQTTYGIPWNEFQIQDGRLWNRHTRTRPCLLHFNRDHHLMKEDGSVVPIVYQWIHTITDRIYQMGQYAQKFPTIMIYTPEITIIQLAKQNAGRYRIPDQSRILERDQDNHHAILAGSAFVHPIQTLDFQGKWADGNRKIIEAFFKWVNVCGTVKLDISLHDYVGYQSNSKEWPHSILGFSTHLDDKHNILIPDLYAMQDYKGSIQKDECTSKMNKLLFIGSTTGKASVQENQRIQLCLYAYGKEWIEAYISSVVNFNPGNIAHVIRQPMTIPEQLKYQHIVVVDGNTACWDRLPWVLASKSVCWKMEATGQCWYYPFLKPWVHYIPFTLENLEETWNRVKDDTGLHMTLIQNANRFFETYLTRQAHGLYLHTLLTEIYHKAGS